jgi:hypothetical protein
LQRVDELRRASAVSATSTKPKGGATSEVPEEFCCKINGHLMKDPVRSPGGMVFERATIEVWLDTRGSICPISGDPLVVDDLVNDDALRVQISAWQIKKTNNPVRNDCGEEEDVYDF